MFGKARVCVQWAFWIRWISFCRGNKGFPNRFCAGIGRFNNWKCGWVRWPPRMKKANIMFSISFGRMECLLEVSSAISPDVFEMRNRFLVSDPTIAVGGVSLDRKKKNVLSHCRMEGAVATVTGNVNGYRRPIRRVIVELKLVISNCT